MTEEMKTLDGINIIEEPPAVPIEKCKITPAYHPQEDDTVCPHCGAKMIITVAMPNDIKVKLYVGADSTLPKTPAKEDGKND